MRPGAEFWPSYLRGQAYLQLKDRRAATIEFRHIVDHRGEVPASMLYALAHLGLARAAALDEDIQTTRAAYERFLSLWKNADPDLDVVRAARIELAQTPAVPRSYKGSRVQR